MTEKSQDEVRLQVHHVRFFDCQPKTIHCICFDTSSSKVAVSRSDGSIEIRDAKSNWIQELVFPGSPDASIEALTWADGRLFAAGLGGNVVELDLLTQSAKSTVSSNAGAIWCLTSNKKENMLAAGTEDGCVVIYDVEEELQYMRGFTKGEGRLMSIAWYEQDEESVIVTGGINNIRQWSVKSGQPLSRMALAVQYNKDTIVWGVVVTKDFVIVSGDSRGIVTFWNGKESTQLKTYHCHKADVLCLCVAEDGATVYSSGVDKIIYKFVPNETNPLPGQHDLPHKQPGGRRSWVVQELHNRHTHDVHSLAHKHGALLSGGVDATLRVATQCKNINRINVSELDPFPQASVVGVAGQVGLVQLQYRQHVDVWRLGAPGDHDDCVRGILPLVRRQIRLVTLQAKKGRQILCSAISPKGISAYSDTKGIRIYQINVENDKSSTPEVSLTNLPCQLKTPARLMTFGSEGGSLIVAATAGPIYVIDISQGVVSHAIHRGNPAPLHRLVAAPQGCHFATAATDHTVRVYDGSTGTLVCQCPLHPHPVAALGFSPHLPTLVIAYSNSSIYEFDVGARELTPWSRAQGGEGCHLPKTFQSPLVRGVAFPPDEGQGHQILLHSDRVLAVLDTTKEVKHKKGIKLGSLRQCYKYKWLVACEFLQDGSLVLVERTPTAVEEALPEALMQRKFGLT